MSVDNVADITPRIQYVASASQTAFDYPFPVFSQTDIVVDVDGVTKTITTHYTVSGVGADTGGTVTFLTGMVGGEIVTIYRDMAIERLTDFQQHGPYSSTSFNDELDRMTLIMQELKSNQGRSLRFPVTSEVTSDETEFDPISGWLDKFVYINASGVPEPAAAVTVGALTQSTIGAAFYPQSTAEAAVPVDPPNKHFYYGDVRRYGAVGDGVTSDKAAIQSGINTGHNIFFPAGTYFLGTQDSGAFLSAASDGQVFVFEGGSTLKGNGNTGVTNTASIVYIDGNSQITFINPRFESNWGVDADRDVPYAVGLGTVNGYTRNITLINPVAYKTQALVQAFKENHSVAYEVENVDIVNGYADNCYYGTGWSYTGNNVRANYKTLNAHRAYFPYGVHTHDIDLLDEHDGTVSGPTSYLHSVHIQASSFTGSLAAKDTHNIRLRYRVKGAQYTGIPFLFSVGEDSADTKRGVLRDIHVTYNDRGTGISKSIGFVYTVDGVTTASYTGTAWDRITIDGYAKNPFDLTNAGVLGSPVVQTVPGTLDIGGLEMNAAPTGVNNPHNGTLFDAGRLFDDAVIGTFTPTVIGTSTAGSGIYDYQVGSYQKRGRMIDATMAIKWTAHDGTGNITVGTLPYAVKTLSNYAVPCTITADDLTFTGQLSARVLSGESVVRVYVAATGAALAPIVMEAAATLYIKASYETN